MKLQSAMEYLMTYGWALLIIVVVLAVLFYLGVFNLGAPAGSICDPYADYLCQNPVLASNGNLIVNFGEIGSTMSITGTACTKGSASPSFNSISTINLESGQETPLSFQCPIPSGRIGTPFSGTLWIQYTSATGTVLSAEIGSVSTSVATSSNSASQGSQSSVLYVPITITNSQNVPTPAPFQQMLTIDSAAYSNDINSAWSNVEFTTGPGATGTPLQAWVESGASNTFSSTIVWVNLPSEIGANSNTVIYMNFMQSNVMSSSGPTGEAPQLSSTYGQYDNGASVFSNYWNFAGTSLPSGLVAGETAGSYSVNNGLTVNGGPTGDSYEGIFSSSSINPQTTITDFYGYLKGTQDYYSQFGLYGSTSASTPQYFIWTSSANDYSLLTFDGTIGAGTTITTSGSQTSPSVFSIWTSASQAYASYNYGNPVSNNANFVASTSQYIGTQVVISNTFIQWMRARAYPPNGVMPSTSFGSAE